MLSLALPGIRMGTGKMHQVALLALAGQGNGESFLSCIHRALGHSRGDSPASGSPTAQMLAPSPNHPFTFT